MILDLTHNTILKESLSESFASSLESNLIPKLKAKYGERLRGIQMYEDYSKEPFCDGEYRYYPMTVLIDGGYSVEWIKWNISNPSEFVGQDPYAFVGDELDFELCPGVPEEFALRLEGRAHYFEGGCVKLNIVTAQGSVSFLAGKYSQSFIDELARQITKAISQTLGVSGLADSTIELDMVFSPESYMEHTSDGVTYRRLLMSAKGCAPRDFWVKWRGKDGAPLSSSVQVSADDIEFSLGEDVPHKAREREYRYLVQGNSDKYRTAMGKKNITEWRELIKRAVKRGELTRTAADTELEQHSGEVADKVAEILERFNISVPKQTENTYPENTDDIASIAKAKLMDYSMSDEPTEPPFIPDEAPAAEEHSAPDDVFLGSLVISKPEAQEARAEAEEQVFVPDVSFDIPVYEAPRKNTEQIREIYDAPSASADVAILRQRLNDESLARSEAEERLASVTSERDALKAELARLNELLGSAKDNFGSAISELTKERDALKAELELEAKERVREKALFAEAARQAREENERLIREREEEEARRAAEQVRLEEARQREREREREEEFRRQEIERIERDIRSREDEKRSALERAAEQSRAMEREALERVKSIGLSQSANAASMPDRAYTEDCSDDAKPDPIGPENHPYTSVTAKLIFRHNVDPNVKGRLYEIISRALEYYKKEHVYIKLKASIPEPAAVLLDFAEFPEGEEELLRGIVKLIGNSDLGVMKIIVE